LGVLFDRYEPDVRRFIGRLGVAASEVDDLLQLAFLDVVRAAASYDGRPSARGWLFGLAAIVVRRHRRSVARIAAGLVAWGREPRADALTAGQTFELHEAAARATRALGRLSPKKREVFVMVVLEDCSGEEAARALGIPVATVWTRLHHARRELREHLAEETS
jgi:RNA polymerase sigma-70 factor (ECF subfamily)